MSVELLAFPHRSVSSRVEGTPALSLRLFGPGEVRVRGGLVLRGGRVVDREWLAGTLWPDAPQEDARRSLRQSLHDLRAALRSEAGRLDGADRRSLRLDLAGAFAEVAAFDAAVEAGDPEALETLATDHGIALGGEPALRLLGALTRFWERRGNVAETRERPEHERRVARQEGRGERDAFRDAWERGGRLSLEEAVAEAL